jgi:hypothetical protein
MMDEQHVRVTALRQFDRLTRPHGHDADRNAGVPLKQRQKKLEEA